MFDDLPAAPSAPPEKSAPHRALYLRFRPKRFEDVVGQEHVTRTLRNAVKLGRPSHAYLFTGPRGTGKTSIARILYRAANCEFANDGDPCNTCALCMAALDGRALDLVEIDAASNRGIDDIRDLRDKVAYHPGEGRYRVYIIDEAHELTPQAWDALLKTLEEPPPHAMFVLATTEAHKVPATIVSRCQTFNFHRIPYQLTRDLLAEVAVAEGMEVEPAVLERLALVARGGLRDALSLLDQLEAFAGGKVDMAVARAALSLPSVEAVRGVIDGMTRRDPAAAMAVLSDTAEGGSDLRQFVEELIVNLRALMLLRTGADVRLGDELPAAEVEWLRERAPAWHVGALMKLVQTLSEALARTRDAAQFQVQTEVAVLTACDAERLAPAPVRPAETRRLEGDVSEGAADTANRPPAGSPSASGTSALSQGGERSEGSAQHGKRDFPADTANRPPAGSPSASGTSAASEGPAGGQRADGSGPPEHAVPGDAANTAPGSRGQHALREAANVAPAASPPADDTSAAAPAATHDAGGSLKSRWADVVEHVKGRNPILASLLGSAQPLALHDNLLVVAFGTDFNRKSAEKATHRQIIETAFERVYGTAYRLRCTVASGPDAAQTLLDDPVINYAQRTFGGEPKRL